MKKYRLSFLIFILLSLLIGSANAGIDYGSCPAYKTYYRDSNGYAPVLTGEYSSAQEFNAAKLAVMQAHWGANYTFVPGGGCSSPETGMMCYTIYNEQGNPVANQQYTATWFPKCPVGFYYDGHDTCPNVTTNTCECPAGTKYKEGAFRCVEYDPAEPTATPDKENGPDCQGQPTCGNPIKPGSGSKIEVELDYVDAKGVLNLPRVYNGYPQSQSYSIGTFGKKWSTIFDAVIYFSPSVNFSQSNGQTVCYRWRDDGTKFCEQPSTPSNSTATAAMIHPDGRKSVFSFINGKYIPDAGEKGTLTVGVSNDYEGDNWNYIAGNGDVEHYFMFNGRGQLSWLLKNGGPTLYFTHHFGSNNSSVSRFPGNAPICNHIQPGPTLYLSANATHILCVTDSWGRQLNFEYSQNGQVTKLIDPTGAQYLYRYDEASGGCDNSDTTNKACTATNLTSVTYPDGGRRIYHYNEPQKINKGFACPSGGIMFGDKFSQSFNILTGITDENGNRFASWEYDCQGRAIASEHAGGAERVELAFTDPDSTGVSRTDVTYYLGTTGNPIKTSSTFTFKVVNGKSLMTGLNQPCPHCVDFSSATYDANGNWASKTMWNGSTTTYQYDPVTNLEVSRTEGQGTPNARTITTVWDATLKKRLKVYSPKLVKSYTYDNYGNMLSRTEQSTTDLTGSSGTSASTVGTPRVWNYTYNQFNQIRTVTGPRTDIVDKTTYEYDAQGNLIRTINALGQVVTYSGYDLNGRVGQITFPNGLVMSRSYTPRGWLSSEQTLSSDGVIETTSYQYDLVGQLTKCINPDGSWIAFSYDSAHRLTSTSDNRGNSITYVLDLSGNRISEQVKDPTGVLTRQVSRVFNALDQMSTVIGAAQ